LLVIPDATTAKAPAVTPEATSPIALHQRKLELLKEQKKGFLQKMFV